MGSITLPTLDDECQVISPLEKQALIRQIQALQNNGRLRRRQFRQERQRLISAAFTPYAALTETKTLKVKPLPSAPKGYVPTVIGKPHLQ